MAARSVRFHFPGGKYHVESMVTFAKANGTDLNGAKRILELWVEKGWIVPRQGGGYDVKNRRDRKDPWTMQQLRAEGFPTPGFIPTGKVRGVRAVLGILTPIDQVPPAEKTGEGVKGQHPNLVIMDEPYG